MVSLPLVSIITPSYNSGKFIEQTILSVIDQDYPNIEHIVVDGGSTDDTQDILEKYPEVSYTVGDDSGMYDAINKGLKMANGEILCYLNADDLFISNIISLIVKTFLNEASDVVIGYCTFIDSENTPLFTNKIPWVQTNLCNKLGRMPFAQPSVFWTSSKMTETGMFDTQYRYSGDLEFFIRLFSDAKISLLRREVSKFRLHSNQLTRHKKSMTNEVLTILDKYRIPPSISPFASYYRFHPTTLSIFRIVYEILYTFLNLPSVAYFIKEKLKKKNKVS